MSSIQERHPAFLRRHARQHRWHILLRMPTIWWDQYITEPPQEKVFFRIDGPALSHYNKYINKWKRTLFEKHCILGKHGELNRECKSFFREPDFGVRVMVLPIFSIRHMLIIHQTRLFLSVYFWWNGMAKVMLFYMLMLASGLLPVLPVYTFIHVFSSQNITEFPP